MVQPETFHLYPVDLSDGYRDARRSRLTVGLRIFTTIPVLVLLALVAEIEPCWTVHKRHPRHRQAPWPGTDTEPGCTGLVVRASGAGSVRG
jgi:hypothetical protein